MNQPAPLGADLRLNVTWMNGVTVFQSKRVRLEWTRQDRIRIIDLETPQEQVILDIAPQEVAKASFVGSVTAQDSQLVLKTVSGKSFRIVLGGAVISPQPWESIEQYNARVAREGVPPDPKWWIDRLAAFGVRAKHTSSGKVVLWTFAGVLIAIAAIVLVMILADAFS